MPIYPYSFQLPPLNVQDIPNDGVAGQFLGINGGGQLDWLPVSAGAGDMLKSENLSGLGSYPTARTNLGLGTTDSPTFKNLVISTGTLTTSAPVTISQTWDALAVAFTAFKVNATSTNSAAGSLLLDLQLGGVSKLNIEKTGNINVDPTNSAATITFNVGATTAFVYNGGSGFGSTQPFTVLAGGGVRVTQGILQLGTSTGAATTLVRDGADHVLALRNSTAAQTFNVYGTYTSGSAYARLAIACDTSGNATLTTQSTGTAGTVSINGVPVGRGKGSNVARNISIGENSLFANTTGADNTSIGYYSMQGNAAGIQNTSIGSQALFNANSNNNVALGYLAGTFKSGGAANNPGNENIYIGSQTKALDTAQTNQIVIGYDATGLGSNTAVLGNSSITTTALRGNVGIGTTAPSSKLHVAETWNAVGTTFTAVNVNVTDTASAAASKLLDLQVGANSLFSVRKDGAILGSNTNTIFGGGVGNFFNGRIHVGDYNFSVGSNSLVQIAIEVDGSDAANAVILNKDAGIYWSSLASANTIGTLRTSADVALRRDGAANTLALRNAGAAQAFRVYNTYTNDLNFERAGFEWGSNVCNFGTHASGSGVFRKLALLGSGIDFVQSNVGLRWSINTSGHFLAGNDNQFDIGASGANRPKDLYVANAITAGSIGSASGNDFILRGASVGAAWKITTSGHLVTQVDNTYDIGASGANRPRNVYVGTSVVSPIINGTSSITSNDFIRATRFLFGGGDLVRLSASSDGVLQLQNATNNGFDRLQFGGTTDAFPAVARDGAGIKFTGAAAGSTSHIKVPAVAVSALPLAATAGVGARAFVNDATAPVFGSAVTGGGSVAVPVYSTGSAWNVG